MENEDTIIGCEHGRQWVGPDKNIKLPCANEECIEGYPKDSIIIKGVGIFVRSLGHYNGDTTVFLSGWALARD